MQGLRSIVTDLTRRETARYLRTASPEFRSSSVIKLQGTPAFGFRETPVFPFSFLTDRQKLWVDCRPSS